MKQKITGIVSGVLLAGVLVGNLIISAISIPETVMTSVTAEESVALPVLAYHNILKDSSGSGNNTVSIGQFEEDLKLIKKKGYTTVSAQQVQDYLVKGIKLPEKPVMLTFDEGFKGVYEYAYPMLQQYEMCAVVSIIGKYTDLYSANKSEDVSYSYVTWSQLEEMTDSEIFEVSNHTYDLVFDTDRKGLMKLENESDDEYLKLLQNDINSLNEEIKDELGIEVCIFTYPYKDYSESSEEALKQMGFRIIFTHGEKVNILNSEKYNQGGIIKLNRFERTGSISSKNLFKKFD